MELARSTINALKKKVTETCPLTQRGLILNFQGTVIAPRIFLLNQTTNPKRFSISV